MRINRDGFRGPDIDYTHAAPRIVTIGDSCTFGMTESSSYPRVLEQRLRERAIAVEVVNAGVEGYTSGDVLIELDRLKALRPQVTTIYLGWNGFFNEEQVFGHPTARDLAADPRCRSGPDDTVRKPPSRGARRVHNAQARGSARPGCDAARRIRSRVSSRDPTNRSRAAVEWQPRRAVDIAQACTRLIVNQPSTCCGSAICRPIPTIRTCLAKLSASIERPVATVGSRRVRGSDRPGGLEPDRADTSRALLLRFCSSDR